MGRQSMPVRHNSRNWLRRSLYGLLDVYKRQVCKRLAPLQPHQRQRAEAQIDRNGGKRRFHAEITARYQRRSGVQHIIEQRISVGLRADVQDVYKRQGAWLFPAG